MGRLNAPVQNTAVILVYPVTLAFHAVNNMYGVGVSSTMSRSSHHSTALCTGSELKPGKFFIPPPKNKNTPSSSGSCLCFPFSMSKER